ncbi:MAG TPA: FmdB family zinc ribbon protein [Anaerolineaceae bacterium]
MPYYEYRCLDCRKRFEVYLTFTDYGKKAVVCPGCGSSNVQRKINRVRTLRTDDARLESMADPSRMDALEDDPRALGKMMREMSKELGEDMGGEFHEVVSRLEHGESPEQIEKDLPDLGSGGADLSGGLDD